MRILLLVSTNNLTNKTHLILCNIFVSAWYTVPSHELIKWVAFVLKYEYEKMLSK